MSRLQLFSRRATTFASSGFPLRRWQLPVQLVYGVLFLSLAFRTPDAFSLDRGKNRRDAGGPDPDPVKMDRRNISVAGSARNNQSGRESRSNYEHWFLNEIKDIILNATGRTNSSRFPSPRPDSSRGSKYENREPSWPANWAPDRGPMDGKDGRPIGAEQRVEEIKFPPDEVSTYSNDVFVSFTLNNYTAKRVDGAELMLQLRYNQSNNHPQSIAASHHDHRPDIRRITIEVYKDSGNATNNGSFLKSPMTTSVFRIRRTKWVKVLLISSWIREAVEALDKALRLHLVYDRSSGVDVVITNREKKKKTKKEPPRTDPDEPRRKLREGSGLRRKDQRIAKRNLGKLQRLSPVLVIRQSGKSTL